MKKKLLALLSAALLAVVVMGLSACGTVGSSTAKLAFGSISTVGKTLTLEVESNGTTGYEWTSAVEGEGIELAGQTVNEGSGSGDAMGQGGTTAFTYEGTGAGEATITLTYQRPWETTDSDREVSVKVTTDASGAITSYEAADSAGTTALLGK